jgi:uncharacterized protein (TIGR02646 family)
MPPPKRSYDFKVYKTAEVREALDELFHGKCAYCEFKRAGAQFDIEHYRPKAQVVEPSGARIGGYWWLASTWNNLLPSCQDCNRKRYQDVDGEPFAFGKENKFPLKDGSIRATQCGGEAAEVPLLMDPTIHNPSAHIEFRVVRDSLQQGVSLVSAKLGADGQPDLIGQMTIDTVGLDRPSLSHQRMATIERMRFSLKLLERDWMRHKAAIYIDERLRIKASIDVDTREVVRLYLTPTAEYSAACRAEYRAWIARIASKKA